MTSSNYLNEKSHPPSSSVPLFFVMDNNNGQQYTLNLFCLREGDIPQNVFLVNINSRDTVSELKERIKSKNPDLPVNAHMLTLWQVSIDTTDNDDGPILLKDVEGKKLNPMDELKDVFKDQPAKKTIHIISQLPRT